MSFFKRYSRAIICALVCANADYWLYELLKLGNLIVTKDLTAITVKDTFTGSFLFPNSILFLPILGGMLIDYIGVIPVLRYLTITLLIGAVILIKAVTSGSLWMYMISALFLGFSVELINIATYIYLANTYLTKTKSIEYFRVAIGIYLILGYILSFIPVHLPPEMIGICIGIGLIVISVLLGSYLQTKPTEYIERMSFDSSHSSLLSSIVSDQGSIHFQEALIREETFTQHNDKFETAEPKGFCQFLKELTWPRLLIILSLGIWVGTFTYLNRIASITYIYEKFITNYYYFFQSAFLIAAGLYLTWKKFYKKKVQRFIKMGLILDFLLLCILGIGLPKSVGTSFFMTKLAASSLTYAMILISIPFYLNFQVESFGKACGIYRWCSCCQQFLSSAVLSSTYNFGFSDIQYDISFMLPIMFSLTVFVIANSKEEKSQRSDRNN